MKVHKTAFHDIKQTGILKNNLLLIYTDGQEPAIPYIPMSMNVHMTQENRKTMRYQEFSLSDLIYRR